MKGNSLIKKYKLYLILIGILLIIFSVYFIMNEIYPYGKNSLLRLDLYSEYYPMLIELKNNILSGNLLYTFNEGIGIPFYRTFFNYLASPFNLIFLVLKDSVLAIHLIIILKIVTMSLSMLYYLKHRFNSDDILLLIPALIYALSGWINAYYFNIMWLDALILLPLITLGIEKLINSKIIFNFIVFLALAIIMNFYMGYMLCIYSVIYFLCYNLYKIKSGSIKYKVNELSRNFLIFLGSSILAVMLCAIILLPIYYASSTMLGKYDELPNSLLYNFNFVDFIASHFAFNNKTVLAIIIPDSLCVPNVYCGIISIVLLIPFIFNKDILRKDKYFYLATLLIITLFFFIPLLDWVINIFHVPASFPYRYSYFYIFILLNIVTLELLNLKSINVKCLIYSGIFISLLFVILFIFKTNKIDSNNLYFNIIFIVGYFLVFIFYKKFKGMKYCLLLIVIIELLVNLNIKSDINTDKINRLNMLNVSNKLYRQAYLDNSNYNNLGLINDFNSVSSFTSMNYSNVYEFLDSIGFETDYSANIRYKDYNPVLNMLLNIDNVYDKDNVIENNYLLSLMFRINSDNTFKYDYLNSPFINQNELIKSLTGIDNLYTKTKYIYKEKIYEDKDIVFYKYKYSDETYMTINPSNIYFLKTGNKLYSIYNVSDKYNSLINGKLLDIVDYHYRSIIKIYNNEIIIGYYKSDIESINEDDIVFSYKLNEDKIKVVYNLLNKDVVNITYNNNYIEGNIINSSDGIMYTSIPYDDGWKVYIDEKEVPTSKLFDTLLTFNIPEGKHKIKLKYIVPNLKIGIIISMISIIILMVIDRYGKKYI